MAVTIPKAVPEIRQFENHQAWAIDWMKVPEVEMICPVKYRR